MAARLTDQQRANMQTLLESSVYRKALVRTCAASAGKNRTSKVWSHFNAISLAQPVPQDRVEENDRLAFFYECKLQENCRVHGSRFVYKHTLDGTGNMDAHAKKCFPETMRKDAVADATKLPSLFSNSTNIREKVGLAVHEMITVDCLPDSLADSPRLHATLELLKHDIFSQKKLSSAEMRTVRWNEYCKTRGLPTKAA